MLSTGAACWALVLGSARRVKAAAVGCQCQVPCTRVHDVVSCTMALPHAAFLQHAGASAIKNTCNTFLQHAGASANKNLWGKGSEGHPGSETNLANCCLRVHVPFICRILVVLHNLQGHIQHKHTHTSTCLL